MEATHGRVKHLHNHDRYDGMGHSRYPSNKPRNIIMMDIHQGAACNQNQCKAAQHGMEENLKRERGKPIIITIKDNSHS